MSTTEDLEKARGLLRRTIFRQPELLDSLRHAIDAITEVLGDDEF